ncbi:response regulator [Alkalihalobacillus sp. MEB130]|uniref:response regulator transcription factor n=1 Tax=Alkalihalobacillus sp. MEB130 TaxID=2976704 RepID=UPI0028DEAE3E|nr:response regulator [Alkalihalobacillus sp. MEB130]MDT8860172.1 response regulator [Alkalihalobacillus sp. MEB130]
MLKAVIADDEYIVTEGLKKMINWSQYGIEVAGTASDGIAALELFQTLKPDIIFTDIRMPGMDGLELIQAVMKESPETICIVFSGFNEFEYVKKAIKLGVADYLEKPVTIPMIEEAIQRTVKRIEEQNEMTSLKLEQKKSQEELLEKATLDLLLQRQDAYQKWREHFGPEAVRIVGVTVIAYAGKDNIRFNSHDSFRVQRVWDGSRDIFVVLHFNEKFDLLEQEIRELSKQVEGKMGSGHTYQDVESVPKSYSDALQALEYGCFLESDTLIQFSDIPENTIVPEELSKDVKDILSAMRNGDEDQTEQHLNQYIEWIEMEKFTRDIIEREILKVIYLGIEVVKETGGEKPSSWLATYQPYIAIRQVSTRVEMLQWLREQVNVMIEWVLKNNSTKKHSAINKALEYIRAQFNEDLTLQQVAEKVDMNPTYFSYLFKEEVGQSYIKYLTSYRLEQAKRLLKSGEKVSSVSEKVGYQTYRHFSEVFKKHTGVTPSQFK